MPEPIVLEPANTEILAEPAEALMPAEVTGKGKALHPQISASNMATLRDVMRVMRRNLARV